MLNKKKGAPPGMISMGRNNYAQNPKNSTVITPDLICRRIYDILAELGFPGIVDVGCNNGALSAPWKGELPITGIDIQDCDFHTPESFIRADFLEILELQGREGWLTLCNPPFNRDKSLVELTQKQFDQLPFITDEGKKRPPYERMIEGTKVVLCVPDGDRKNFQKIPFKIVPEKYPKLPPERFLRQIVKLFGPKFKGVFFTPMGLRLNQDWGSPRWRWMRDFGGRITSILSLPKDIFPGVKFHTEVLFFNIDGLHPHYFLEG